ncbi:hypothetical protein NSU_2811 [Novosphingobium pentaromativorans US6-1]|uniref:Uncharacterized protein n=1 Tax=Novosphingobium pentaromativorans US6-1 TaxID=1088721 RepID=G6EEP0_9SPHN|nr:hypothetical protein NSU_2811 [Novosphingobium pentaromativorans US6-1]
MKIGSGADKRLISAVIEAFRSDPVLENAYGWGAPRNDQERGAIGAISKLR